MAATAEDDVAAHYNRRAQTSTLEARRVSPIVQLRNLNNWIKSVLLGQVRAARVGPGPRAARVPDPPVG
jgi:hypothetical protein